MFNKFCLPTKFNPGETQCGQYTCVSVVTVTLFYSELFRTKNYYNNRSDHTEDMYLGTTRGGIHWANSPS